MRRLLRPALRALLRGNVGPADGLIYAWAVAWLLFLLLVPEAAFLRLAAVRPLLAYKDVWLWPTAACAVVAPVGWAAPWRSLRHLARLYRLGYWLFIAAATWLVTPTVVVFWLPALVNAGGMLWLIAREGAKALRADETGR